MSTSIVILKTGEKIITDLQEAFDGDDENKNVSCLSVDTAKVRVEVWIKAGSDSLFDHSKHAKSICLTQNAQEADRNRVKDSVLSLVRSCCHKCLNHLVIVLDHCPLRLLTHSLWNCLNELHEH